MSKQKKQPDLHSLCIRSPYTCPWGTPEMAQLTLEAGGGELMERWWWMDEQKVHPAFSLTWYGSFGFRKCVLMLFFWGGQIIDHFFWWWMNWGELIDIYYIIYIWLVVSDSISWNSDLFSPCSLGRERVYIESVQLHGCQVLQKQYQWKLPRRILTERKRSTCFFFLKTRYFEGELNITINILSPSQVVGKDIFLFWWVRHFIGLWRVHYHYHLTSNYGCLKWDCLVLSSVRSTEWRASTKTSSWFPMVVSVPHWKQRSFTEQYEKMHNVRLRALSLRPEWWCLTKQ